MTVRFSIVLLITILVAGVAKAQEPDSPENGASLYSQNCASCHGDYGEVSNDVIPNILGQYPGYVLQQLAFFVDPDPSSARGGVSGDIKRSLLLELTIQDFRDIVTYLDTVPYDVVGASEQEAKSRSELAYQGWWLANYAGCGNCHGDDQKGLRLRDPETGDMDPTIYAPFTPKLMGLKGAYIERQLVNYMEGRRAGGLAAMKHTMAPLFLTPRLIQAIGEYSKDVHIVPKPETNNETGETQ
ncbi:MAG: c-type cytochrome [Roseibium sp.]